MAKRQKIIVFLLCIALVFAFLLSGCSNNKSSSDIDANNSSDEDKTQKSANNDKKVTLSMMYWDQVQKPVIDKMIDDFEKDNPNIKVDATIVPWAQYWEKLQTTTVGNNAPDVFWMNIPNFPKYADNGSLLELQKYIERDGVDVSNYPKDLIEGYSYNGKVCAIPEQYDTIALVYNKEMFDKAGVEYPDDTWTWDTLRENARKLTIKGDDGKIIQYGFASLNANQSGYYNFMVMNGGGIISEDHKTSLFDKPESIEAIQFLLDLIYKDGVSPTGQQMIDTTGEDLFNSGKVAMTTIGSWYVPIVYESLGDKADIAPLPMSPNTNERKTIIHGLSWAGYAKTKYPEETWKLINHLISKDSMALLAKEGITIPSYKGIEEDWVNAIPSMNLQVFVDAANYSHPYPVSLRASEWMEVEAKELTDAWMNKQNADQAMKKIAEQMNEILASEK
jgi:multiple sugar transport system substrate-binding protein